MTTRHKWADVIIAYAEGKEIQYLNDSNSVWYTASDLDGIGSIPLQWRIKPEVKTGWIVVLRNSEVSPFVYPVKQNCTTDPDAVACIQITYFEGEGLE